MQGFIDFAFTKAPFQQSFIDTSTDHLMGVVRYGDGVHLVIWAVYSYVAALTAVLIDAKPKLTTCLNPTFLG